MNEIEVHIDLEGATCRVGTLFRQAARGRESVTFEYHDAWLTHPARFSLEPGLGVGKGMFHSGEGTCSIELALAQAGLFGLSQPQARAIASEVGKAVSHWRTLAAQTGETPSRIDRMASAFEPDDLARAQA